MTLCVETPLLPDQTLSPNECPFCGNTEKQNFIGGPINTVTGNYNYETTDLSIPSVGHPLQFERAYNSLTVSGTVVYSRPLGYGWTHNYDIDLTFSDAPGGEQGTVILKAPHGSRLRFTEISTGTYAPYPGVWASMARQGTIPPYHYVITAANQTVYTFTESLLPTTIVTASNGATFDRFGASVAMSGNTAIVGTFNDSLDSAYVFVHNGTTWAQQAVLTPTDTADEVTFGASVAISGNIAVVGAPGLGPSSAGAAYIFVRSGTTWTQEAKLSDYGADFGHRVAISGETTVISAYGAGFAVYVRSGTTWTEQQHELGGVYVNDVAISGDTIIAGTPFDDNNTGKAYIYERSGTTWTEQAQISASDGADEDYFGVRVAIDGDTAMAGAFQEDQAAANAGSVYVFAGSGSNWGQNCTGTPLVCTETQKLTAADGAADDHFGSSVALSGSTALIGAPGDDDQGSASGSAYIFEAEGATWSQQNKLTAPAGAAGDDFGSSVAISGTAVIIGAPGRDNDKGAAYLFNLAASPAHFLTAIRDPQGNLAGFNYTGLTLTRVTDTRSGRYLNFGYDSLGRVITLTDQTNRTVTYDYNANGDLTTVRDARGFTWTYTYSGTTHLLRQVLDPENKVLEQTSYELVNGEAKATLQQDGAGRTLAQIDYLAGGQRRITVGGQVMTDTYDSRNLLVSQTDALGRSQDYSLDDSFNRTGQTDIRNQTTSYQRTSLGLTTAITNALDQTTTLEYDGNNNLSAIIEDDGTLTDYVYDNQNNLRQIGTISGTIYFDYNDFGQVISTTNRRGYPTQYGYDQIGNPTVITDTKGQTTTFTYDALGRVETTTNTRGMVTRYQYDPGDNLRFITENYQTSYCPANECNLTTEFQYDNAGRLVWLIDPANRRTRREYDAGGRLERVTLNYQDGVFSSSTPDEDMIIRYGYDSSGRLQSLFETPAAGAERETRLTYDALSRVQSVIFNYVPGGSAPDQNLTTGYQYQDDTVPALVTITGPTGLVTRSEYDALGRLAKRIDNYQATACPADTCNLTTRYEYDEVGNLKRVYDPANLRTEYEYDRLHRLTGVIENYAGSGVYSGIVDENIKTIYQYDNEGNLTRVTPPLNTETIFRYDELNRLDQVENALSHLVDYDYDPAGNLSQLTKPDTKVINYQYDLLNRLTRIDYPNPEVDVTFGYDNASRRTTMTDATGSTGYTYDDLDRLTGVTDGNNQAVAYRYDARGNRTRLTYPDGRVVDYGYDNADRLAVVSPDWDSGDYTYQYANHRLITMTNPAGVVTTYGYDDANRLTGLTHRQAGQTLAGYTYSLDSTGNVRTVTETQVLLLPAGAYQESGGQLVMESENGQRTAGLTHAWLTATAQSGYTGTAYLQTSLDIDQLYQPGQITPSPRAEYTVHFTTPGTYTVWLRGYPANAAGDSVYLSLGSSGQPLGLTGFAPGQWSWAGLRLDTGAPLTLTVQSSGLYTLGLRMREDGLRIDRLLLTTDTTYIPTGFGPPETTRLTDQLTGPALITRTIVYTYDDLYRLTNATYSTGELFAYTYDPAGNRKTQTTLAGTTVYTYDTANRLTQVDGQSYTWDNNGNLLNDGLRTFTYDSADRLTSVINAGVTTQFIYNGDGDRLAQSVAGVPTNYVLDPVGLAEVLVETTSGQNTYYLPGLAQSDPAWSYYLPDRLGSLRHLVDPNATLLLAQSYDPFGNVLEQVGSGQSSFGYTGEQTDPTGLVYLRARYYHPAVGRFITADSIIPNPFRSQEWNRYAYVRNNPIRYTDPSGHCIGILAGIDTVVCVEIVVLGGLLFYTTFLLVTSDAYQDALAGVVESLSPSPPADYEQQILSYPLEVEEIIPCYQPGSNVGQPDPWQLPPFSLTTPPYFGPVTPGVPTYPDIELPNILTASGLEGLTAREIIGKYKRGSIRREFPTQFLDWTFEEIQKVARTGNKQARKAMKLLTDQRFDK